MSPLKDSHIRIPKLYASTAVVGFRFIVSHPACSSGGAYLAASGNNDPWLYMIASSSFKLLSTSKPPSFHSPLSLVYTDATRMAPCIEDASSLMNLTVCATLKRPHFTVSSLILLRLICHRRGVTRSVAMYMYVSVSTLSKTLITPGCRKVRSFLTAFRASVRRDLFAITSKEKILQLEPSS